MFLARKILRKNLLPKTYVQLVLFSRKNFPNKDINMSHVFSETIARIRKIY